MGPPEDREYSVMLVTPEEMVTLEEMVTPEEMEFLVKS
jgi:hypothetical protein